jgi:hypothetical protein
MGQYKTLRGERKIDRGDVSSSARHLFFAHAVLQALIAIDRHAGAQLGRRRFGTIFRIILRTHCAQQAMREDRTCIIF